jgi:hypothetical protein
MLRRHPPCIVQSKFGDVAIPAALHLALLLEEARDLDASSSSSARLLCGFNVLFVFLGYFYKQLCGINVCFRRAAV